MMTEMRRAEAEPETDRREPETGSGHETNSAQAAGTAGMAGAAEADPAEKLAREASDLRDRLLRTLAEMENLRRRTEREIADSRAYAVAAFARDILGVADNMARALQSPAAELRQRGDAGVKALLDGVELTERELLKVLEKHGVRKFEPQGEKFDPNLHQAMYEVPDPDLPVGTVAHVVQAGYMIGDRMLRPALVAVAKGGPKVGAAAGSANDNAGASPPSPTDAA
jgi:molecular chaperone GrpE